MRPFEVGTGEPMKIAILDDYQNVALRMADWSAEGLDWARTHDDLHQVAEGRLSKLVHLRTGQKPISDARIATYVILSIGSGLGGRWFKSIRPDHFF